MLYDPLRECFRCVIILHLNGPLQNNCPVVKILVDKMYRATVFFGRLKPSRRIGPGVQALVYTGETLPAKDALPGFDRRLFQSLFLKLSGQYDEKTFLTASRMLS